MTIFSNRPQAIASMKADRLARLAANYGISPSDEEIYDKLLSAEADLERQLRTWFSPREVIPTVALQAEEDALVAAGATVEREPGYDYNPSMWQGDTWGMIQLRQRPLIAVHRISFYYPGPTTQVWEIPPTWFRVDPKPGLVSLVPDQTAVAMPLNAFILSWMAGARTVPLMVQVRYSAGLTDVAGKWPDLMDTIKKQAVLSILDDEFLPTSGSVSADGLSQSISMDSSKYRDLIDARVERLRQAMRGIRLTVV